MTYEAWRCTYQDSEQAARSAFRHIEELEAWKASAMRVLREWDQVFERLGRPGKPGDSKALATLAYLTTGKAEVM